MLHFLQPCIVVLIYAVLFAKSVFVDCYRAKESVAKLNILYVGLLKKGILHKKKIGLHFQYKFNAIYAVLFAKIDKLQCVIILRLFH